jgi:cobalt-precorrin 5A hydrolase
MSDIAKKNLAVWSLTAQGARVAYRVATKTADADLYIPSKLKLQINTVDCSAFTFTAFSRSVAEVFHQYKGHIFIMSTGIVIRIIAPLIRHKTKDPAIVVLDEKELHVVSLLSGHIGGANELTLQVAEITGADPVITTATDINKLPAIDQIAVEKGLRIENPKAIKTVSMTLLSGKKIMLHDPYKYFRGTLSAAHIMEVDYRPDSDIIAEKRVNLKTAGVFINYIASGMPAHFLKLRPVILSVGIGCNRNTSRQEIKDFLRKILARFDLSPLSLINLASIDLKADEKGLLELALDLDLPINFYSKTELAQVKAIENPSLMVKKHIGVTSVCEASAILAAGNGSLIVPKQIKGNTTIAIARTSSI